MASSQPRAVRTQLASSAEFRDAYKRLFKDRSVGRKAVKFDPPAEFDGPKIWAKYLPPVRNQGGCGSCWAFASTACLGARIAIATRGRVQPELSPGAMVFCNLGGEYEYAEALKTLAAGQPYDMIPPDERESRREAEKKRAAEVGCQGETLIGAWQYIFRFAIPEEKCFPYIGCGSNNTDLRTFDNEDPNTPACADLKGDFFDMCPAGNRQPIIYHTCSGYYYVPGTATSALEVSDVATPLTTGDEATVAELYAKRAGDTDTAPETGSELDIRREIYHWGPVTSGFSVYDDFMAWDGKNPAVYQWDGASAEQGGHAIVIVGWGTSSEGTPFWWIRNSWGPEWGVNGYFRIRRGENECGIEENIIVGLPNLYGYRQYVDRPLLYTPDDLVMRQIWRITPSGAKATMFDAMLSSTMPVNAVNVDEHVYPSRYWPNLETFVAGKPNATEFPLDRGLLRYAFAPRNGEELAKARFFWGLLGVAAVGGFAWLAAGRPHLRIERR